MPLKTDWDPTDKTTVRLTYDGKWTVNDLHQFFDQVTRMAQEANQRVNIISDMRNATSSPANMFTVLTRAERVFSAHVNLIIVVAANKYFTALGAVAQKMAPKAFAKFHFVATLDQAHAILQQAGAPASADADAL